MDTQPIEFLSHHLPLLFFAGLNPITSTPVPEDVKNVNPILQNPSSVPIDPFQALSNSLRHALTINQSGIQIWDPRTYHQNSKPPDFRVVMVDKNVRFPPRKARPSSNSNPSSSMIHSPLSPLTPNSPLYPDGIMTPIWIRKHRDMIPSVFVLTLTLWEPPSSMAKFKENNLNGSGNGTDEIDSKEFEQQKSFDHQLIYEIIERKKTTTERGIKLVVVILTSKTMLDHPSLDMRLSYIRRQSGLDSRSSLFILSPVIDSEILSFVKTLKSELFESSLDYYREHSRKVRRKRSRSNSIVHQSNLNNSYSKSNQPILNSLGQQGWIVRSDFKLATFAEFRQEYDVALKSYEDCWIGLSGMFSSTAILPPRTKRWAEAKVLIDCINIKICKFYFYSQETSRAMDQFSKHVNRFRDLCNGWGIGDETFEYWSWLSKQYTMFSELIECGCRNGLRLPNLLPNPSTSFNEVNFFSLNHPSDHLQIPANVLLHPGFYYYQSGVCATHRRDKFRASEIAEEQMKSIAKSKDQAATFQGSAALAYERKVNHTELIIGLFTKAYELFKRFNSIRMTLFLAFKIAMIHFDNQDYVTAGKFFERITSTYRKERFKPILDNALMRFYESIKLEIGYPLIKFENDRPEFERFEKLLEISYELIDSNCLIVPIETKAKICDELQDMIQIPGNGSIESPRLITLDMTNSTSPLRSEVVFWNSSAQLGDTINFQLKIYSENPFPGYHLSFTSCELHFSNFSTIIIHHQSQEVKPLINLDLHEISEESLKFEGNLSWTNEFNLMIFNGEFKPLMTKPISPQQDYSNFRWVHEVDEKTNESKYLTTEGLSSFCQVRDKIPLARAEIENEELVLLDETGSIKVKLYNDEEDETLVFKLDVECRDPVSEKDTLMIDEESNMINLNEYTLCSLEPRGSIEKIITLQPSLAGNRHMKLTVNAIKQSQATTNSVEETSTLEETDLPFFPSCQLIKPILLQVKDPFLCEFDIRYLNLNRNSINRKLSDCCLPDLWDKSDRVLVNVIIKSNDLIKLSLNQIQIQCENVVTPIKVLSSSISSNEEDNAFPLEPGSALSIGYVIELATGSQSDNCALKITWERSMKKTSDLNSTHTTIHPIRFPIKKKPPILITNNLPPHLKIYEKCKITYLIENQSQNQMKTLNYELKPSDEWIFSGKRLIESFKLLPGMKRSIEIIGIPIVLGLIEIPKVIFFEKVNKNTLKRNDEEDGGGLIEEILRGIDEFDEDDRGDDRGDLDGVRELKVFREFEHVKGVENEQVYQHQHQHQQNLNSSKSGGFNQILVFP
ncbi:uncharacterized protein MELLADRAFT_63177 [Melampsora larici-populina 98AG31]|uniref:Trafficking protein particle complex subunit 11 domain-containing protein n=1 Tax=Melampsora larici-populina (strain 98AG31 / pathotype 3-4-7) TaxID=747676 RepID=F4RLQ1_MELLP|nr:uncharacterized protein MELLADRAFT_63177 [Melampsora larici-populina 98AG31]EGG06574.1 hypothetical protein MELLADRAFT_63177 [Melampsora larici-populina 98AG31]